MSLCLHMHDRSHLSVVRFCTPASIPFSAMLFIYDYGLWRVFVFTFITCYLVNYCCRSIAHSCINWSTAKLLRIFFCMAINLICAQITVDAGDDVGAGTTEEENVIKFQETRRERTRRLNDRSTSQLGVAMP